VHTLRHSGVYPALAEQHLLKTDTDLRYIKSLLSHANSKVTAQIAIGVYTHYYQRIWSNKKPIR